MNEITEDMVDDDPKQEAVEETTEVPDNSQSTEIVGYQEWEVQEFIDDAVAQGTVDAYVYAYQQGGRLVTGLSARAIEHMGLERNISVKIIDVSEQDDGVLITVEASMRNIIPARKETKPDGTVIEYEEVVDAITAPGLFYTPKMAYGKPDMFYHAKCLTKAGRNARRQLIPIVAQEEAKKTLLSLQGGKPANVPTDVIPKGSRQQQPPPQQQAKKEEDPIDTARKAAFALFGEKETDLMNSLNISSPQFWEAVKAHYKVESRTEMIEQQWRNLRSSLNIKGYASWIKDINKPSEAEHEEDVEAEVVEEAEAEKPVDTSGAKVDDEIPW